MLYWEVGPKHAEYDVRRSSETRFSAFALSLPITYYNDLYNLI